MKKLNLNKRKKIFLCVLASILILAAIFAVYMFCFNKNEKEKPKPTKKPKEEKEEVIKKLTVYDEDSNQRPIAIMIDNNVGNEYHSGLQDSYLNYEIIVEGGLTRIMAIFKDKDISQIGPVRSSRHYFLDYALESDCIYTHFGWSPYAQQDIKALGVNNINGLYDDYPFWRASHLYAPHNVFTSTAKIYEYAAQKGYSTTSENWKLLKYSTDEVNLNAPIKYETVTNEETGKKEKVPVTNPALLPANSVVMSYSNYQTRSYTYDAENKYYLRSMNYNPHIDYETKSQLHYKNLIIIYVTNRQFDREGRQDLDTVGSGTGYYLTNGYALPINWTKSSRSDKTKYTYTDGNEITLNDGNTFIQIVPTGRDVTIQ